MIDPLLSPKQPTTSLERLALMDRPTPPVRRKRAMPARTSKIITASASATALLSMVAGMGWQSGTTSANGVTAPDTTPSLAPVLPVAQPAPSGAAPASVLPPVITVPIPAASVPTATVPTAPVPVVTVAVVKRPVQVVVPKAVPVATLPVQTVVKHKSHTTTRSSG